jgi:GNAT superfamily N-acetyltransferase
MKIRSMKREDRPQVVAVYKARTTASSGLMARNRFYWRARWPRRNSKDIWLVAVDRGRVAGYAKGFFDPHPIWALETHWRPEYDGTSLGDRLLQALLARIERRHPVAVSAWVTEGSPALPLYGRILRHPTSRSSVFMAGVANPSALLRDAARVVEPRLERGRRVRLRTGRHETVTAGQGRPVATASFHPDALLGILLGIRGFETELRRGTVKVQPPSREALAVLRAAFPPRRFFIQDAW